MPRIRRRINVPTSPPRPPNSGGSPNFALRYKQAFDGGNEASAGLASFLLAQEFDDEATSLLRQIEIGNARLASPMGGTAELGYRRGLARLNERAVATVRQHRNRDRSGEGRWRLEPRPVRQWTRSWIGCSARSTASVNQPTACWTTPSIRMPRTLVDDLRDINDAVRIFEENRFVDHRMQWPVRRKDELTAAIPHREAEIQGHMMGQQRLEDASGGLTPRGQTTVRYTPYNPEGYPGGVAVMPLAQAEANLVANADGDPHLATRPRSTNRCNSPPSKAPSINASPSSERELSDVDVPPNPVELALGEPGHPTSRGT